MSEAYKPRLAQFKEAPMEPIEEEATYQVAFDPELEDQLYELPFEASALDAVITEYRELGEVQTAVPGGSCVWTIEGYVPGLLGPLIQADGEEVTNYESLTVQEELTDEGYVHHLTVTWPPYVSDPGDPGYDPDQLPEVGLDVSAVYGVKKKLDPEDVDLSASGFRVDLSSVMPDDILGSQLTILYRKKTRGAFERPED